MGLQGVLGVSEPIGGVAAAVTTNAVATNAVATNAVATKTASEDQAKRLLRRLELPDGAAKVLEHERYWNAAFCAAFLNACDQQLFEDPRAGLPMAQCAPRLAEMLPESRDKQDLRVRSLALLAGANRANGNLFEAAATYNLAFRIAERSTLSQAIVGDLHRRYSNLLIDQGRYPDALRAAQKAIEIFEQVPSGPDDFCLGAALLQRGIIRLRQERIDEAIRDFGMALTALDPRRNERSYYAAAHNLAYALASAPDLQQISQATRYLRYARELLKGQRASLARYKLYALEAQVLVRLGSTRRAEKNLQIAREGFQRIGAFHEFVGISIELAGMFQGEGRVREVREITAETLAVCQGSAFTAEILALLATWQKAVDEQRLSAGFLDGLGRDLHYAFQRARRRT